MPSFELHFLDESGLSRLWDKITAYVDNSGGVAVQSDAPESHSKLWIDISEGGVAKYWNESTSQWEIVKSTWS